MIDLVKIVVLLIRNKDILLNGVYLKKVEKKDIKVQN